MQEQIVPERIEEQIGDTLVPRTVDLEHIIAGETAQNIVRVSFCAGTTENTRISRGTSH